MMKEMMTGVFDYNGESYNFNFKTSLSSYEKMIFVNTVVDNLITDNRYDVVIRDLIFDFIIIDAFTNVDTSFIDITDDDGNNINPIIIIEHFLEETDIVDIVKASMEDGLLDELNNAVNLNIQYRTGISINRLSDSVANLVSTLEKKVNQVDLDSMMEMAQKFANMTEEFAIEDVVNAYMNSDVHKNNLDEISKAKKKNNNKNKSVKP